jgi:hypothetical protein
VIAVRGTQATALGLLESEFTGTGSFVPWIIAIIILCSIGYIKPVRPLADSFVGLLLLAIVIGAYKKGTNIFAAFNQQIRNPVAAAAPAPAANPLRDVPPETLQQPSTPGQIVPNPIPGIL